MQHALLLLHILHFTFQLFNLARFGTDHFLLLLSFFTTVLQRRTPFCSLLLFGLQTDDVSSYKRV